MKQPAGIITILFFFILLCSFIISGADTPCRHTSQAKETIRKYYTEEFTKLSLQIAALKESVVQDNPERLIHQRFLQARLTYKHLELYLEYYFELDVSKFNGLATDFIEEEDPAAYQEPQGFQVIEGFLYPHYNKARKKELLEYIDKLQSITNGLGNNTSLFVPDDYMTDAAMEELYRVLALGISGFDSPIAQLSLPEAKASLESVRVLLQAYKEEMLQKKITGYAAALQLIDEAKAYIDAHNSFAAFDRMTFITRYLNPLCNWLGHATAQLGYGANPARYTLIKKTGDLFKANSLQPGIYLYDDSMTAAKISLGKKLFYEPLLSANGKRSCAGCHQPSKAFADGLAKALQIDEHTALPRNTPTLWNAALQRNLFYDSRQTSLDYLITEVLSNSREMNSSADSGSIQLSRQQEYTALYRQAYPGTGNPITGRHTVNAIAAYVRTLISYNSRFDKYMRGQKDKLTAIEIKGFNVFMGKARCGTCHYAPLFNGSKPPTYYYQESEVIGVPATTDTLHAVVDTDPGRYAVLKRDFLLHAFKTPTLRNIALTAPYMHNGVYKTLEEVIDFYDRGGGAGLHMDISNQTLQVDRLHLTAREKKQLIAFLGTLTDTVQSAVYSQQVAVSSQESRINSSDLPLQAAHWMPLTANWLKTRTFDDFILKPISHAATGFCTYKTADRD